MCQYLQCRYLQDLDEMGCLTLTLTFTFTLTLTLNVGFGLHRWLLYCLTLTLTLLYNVRLLFYEVQLLFCDGSLLLNRCFEWLDDILSLDNTSSVHPCKIHVSV